MGNNRKKSRSYQNLAVIPAKGCSKGLPGKNLLLLPHTIEIAKQAYCVDDIIVSTDDGRIGAIAHEHGALIMWRPEELCTDDTSSEEAILHVLDNIDYVPGYTIFLQCTAPLTLPIDIDNCFMRLIDGKGDMAFTVAPVKYNLWGDGGMPINHDPSCRLPRQKVKAQYLETGAVYIMKTEGFKKAKTRFFGKIVYSVIPRNRCLEIDDLEDLGDVRLRHSRYWN